MKKPNILLIYTGGTIGMIKDSKTGALGAFDFENLIVKSFSESHPAHFFLTEYYKVGYDPNSVVIYSKNVFFEKLLHIEIILSLSKVIFFCKNN